MRKKGLFLGLLCLLLFVSGCWNRRELNELAIAVALAIDKDGKDYKVSVQVVNPGAVAAKGGNNSYLPVTFYQQSGGTIFEALRKMTSVSPRKIYLSHLRMLIISEELARNGIGKVLDLVLRDQEVRSDFYVVIAKEEQKAEDTLKILTTIEKIPAIKLFSSLEASQKAWAPTSAITLFDLASTLAEEGKQPVLTGLELRHLNKQGETRANIDSIQPITTLAYSGLGVFRRDKLIGWLNEEQSKGYNYITNQVKSTIGEIKCPKGGIMGLEVIRSQAKIKGKFVKGQPEITIQVRAEDNVGEVECKVDLMDPKVIAELEQSAEKQFEQLIMSTISSVQKKYQADIFGFGSALHRADPKAWKKIRKDWETKYFPKLKVNIKADIHIRRLGKASNPLTQYIKE
ncbi:Ger(x)C family spore germination protein [Brevibacillus fluminis]|uniref:Ger(X)C family spore germination protein n=1 Tax=Brevibacillus fluminis TaxID=511487 RepID=A0A3M8DF62_9BACL|nr:Ger(x)C family spore germination protein [Brevibacillus fluminis]RNB85965.1 Ger(x)C family spore germination protein [Brevibacillus fluminis]